MKVASNRSSLKNQQYLHCHKHHSFTVMLTSVSLIMLSLIVIGGVLKILLFKPHTVVVVEFNEQQCIIEEAFELMWIHSVEKQWWIEAYEIKENQLLLTDTYLQTFGAGTPSIQAPAKSSNKYPDYIHYRVDTHLPHLNWMISSNIQARLIIDSQSSLPRSLPIYQWVDDYTNIHIYPSRQSLWNLKQQESCEDYANRVESHKTA